MPSGMQDLTQDGCPDELLALAHTAASARLIQVSDYRRPWSSAKLYRFWTEEGTYLKFMRTADAYVQINSPSGIVAINDLLEEYRFSHDDFGDPESVHWFLKELVSLYGHRRGAVVGSSVMLRISERDGGVALWLEGTEESEEAFLELCHDPQFMFDDRAWKVDFHVFNQGGSVELWEMAGEHDAEHNCNRIRSINVALVKPKGTFYHEVMGAR